MTWIFVGFLDWIPQFIKKFLLKLFTVYFTQKLNLWVQEMSYLLSSIIFGHTKDVRCIFPLQDGSNYLVSGNVKSDNSKNFSVKLTFRNNKEFG